jgi:hypothetical protein
MRRDAKVFANYLGAAKEMAARYAELAELTPTELDQIGYAIRKIKSPAERKTIAKMLHAKEFSTRQIADLTGWDHSTIAGDLRSMRGVEKSTESVEKSTPAKPSATGSAATKEHRERVAEEAAAEGVTEAPTDKYILEKAFQVIHAWGFEYKASFIWDKIKHNMGHYNSVRHEILYICTRGSCQPDKQELFDSVQSIERGKHSQKPVEFYDIIETIYTHGRKLEIFARAKRDGWDNYGHLAEIAEAAE